MKKRILTLCIMMAMALPVAACGRGEVEAHVDTTPASVSTASAPSTPASVSSVEETEPETYEKYFYIEDVFTITLDDVKYTVVAGYPIGGTIYVGDTLVLDRDGEKIETKVVSFETLQDEHPTSVGENEAIAVWLDKYLSQTIKAGDKLMDASVK